MYKRLNLDKIFDIDFFQIKGRKINVNQHRVHLNDSSSAELKKTNKSSFFNANC